MDVAAVKAKAEEVHHLMGQQLSIGGSDLSARTRKAGRLLPRRIRRDATYLGEAAKLVENPKLVKMIDFSKIDQAHRACLHYLGGVDVADRRRGYVLGILGNVGLGVLALAGAGISLLVWRGYI